MYYPLIQRQHENLRRLNRILMQLLSLIFIVFHVYILLISPPKNLQHLFDIFYESTPTSIAGFILVPFLPCFWRSVCMTLILAMIITHYSLQLFTLLTSYCVIARCWLQFPKAFRLELLIGAYEELRCDAGTQSCILTVWQKISQKLVLSCSISPKADLLRLM